MNSFYFLNKYLLRGREQRRVRKGWNDYRVRGCGGGAVTQVEVKVFIQLMCIMEHLKNR